MGYRSLRVLAAACVVGLGGVSAAASASADGTDPAYPGSSVHVKVSGPLQAGKVLTITATGSNALDDPSGAPAIDYGLELIVVDPNILKGPCEVSEQKELSDITNVPSGGQLLNYDDLTEGSSGPFTIRLPYEPGGYGPLLVCAYSKYITDDAAYASTRVQIKPATPTHGGGPGQAKAKPKALGRPEVHRSHGRLTCTRGRWANHPTRFTYRWKLGSGSFGSARTSARLTLPPTSKASSVVCSVTAANAKGSARRSSRPLRL